MSAFPSLPSTTKLKGVNLVPKPTDTGNGDYGIGACFYDTYRLWDWSGWIKPQIDAAKSLGANCIRLQGDYLIRYGTGAGDYNGGGAFVWNGTISAATYAAHLTQIINYCASMGMYFYATGTPIGCVSSSVSLATMNTYLTEYVTLVSSNSFTNVIGIDVIQEFDGGNASSWTAKAVANCSSIISNAKSALVKTLPVTCSMTGAASAADLNPATRSSFATLNTAGADYFDCHIYYMTFPSDLTAAINNSYGQPVFVGEIGIDYNGLFGSGSAQETTHPYSSERRADFYDMISGMQRRSDIQGLCVWASVREWSTDAQDWGLFSNHQGLLSSDTYSNGTNSFDIPYAEQSTRFSQFLNYTETSNTFQVATTGNQSYSPYGAYGVGTRMVAVTANVWTRVSNLIQGAGTSNDTVGQLYNAYMPVGTNQGVQFDIPINGIVSLYSSQYATWGALLRNNGSTSDHYYIQWIRDTSGAADMEIDIYKYPGGASTSLASVKLGTSYNAAHTYRCKVTATGINPTVLVASIQDLTADPTGTNIKSCTVSDSTSTLQISTGGHGLCARLGTVLYSNVIIAPDSNNLALPTSLQPVMSAYRAFNTFNAGFSMFAGGIRG